MASDRIEREPVRPAASTLPLPPRTQPPSGIGERPGVAREELEGPVGCMRLAIGAESADDDRQFSVFAGNLLAIVGLGVAVCFWTWHRTDWFPVLASVLTFGGVFVWLSFLSGVVTGARKEQLQAWIDDRLLQNPRTWKWTLFALFLGLLAWSITGTITIEHLEGGLERVVEITDGQGQQFVGPTRLTPGATRNHLIVVGWGSIDAFVEIRGLPTKTVRLTSFGTEKISVPGSFIVEPVLLVRLDSILSATLAGTDAFRLTIRVDDKPAGEIYPYHGELVWVGGDAGVAVPADRREAWARELALLDPPGPPPRNWWRQTAVMRADAPTRPVKLAHGQRVEVVLQRESESAGGEAPPEIGETAIVIKPARASDYPQEVTLRAPERGTR